MHRFLTWPSRWVWLNVNQISEAEPSGTRTFYDDQGDQSIEGPSVAVIMASGRTYTINTTVEYLESITQ